MLVETSCNADSISIYRKFLSRIEKESAGTESGIVAMEVDQGGDDSKEESCLAKLVAALVGELINPNSTGRESAKKALNAISARIEIDLGVMLRQFQEMLLGPVINPNILNSQPVSVRIGQISAVIVCLTVKPPLAQYRDIERLVRDAINEFGDDSSSTSTATPQPPQYGSMNSRNGRTLLATRLKLE